jgi:predicted secreted protein
MYFLISDCSRCKVPHTVNKTELRQFVVGEEEISELFKAKKKIKKILKLNKRVSLFKERRM